MATPRYYGGGTRLASIDGLTETKAALEALPASFREVVALTIAEAAQIIFEEARSRVPVLTGGLYRSIGVNIRKDGMQAAIGSGAEHAPFVEFGTKQTPAQPWLYPAFLRGARHVRKTMRDWVGDAGERAVVRSRRGKNVRAISKLAKRGQRYGGRPRTDRGGRASRVPSR